MLPSWPYETYDTSAFLTCLASRLLGWCIAVFSTHAQTSSEGQTVSDKWWLFPVSSHTRIGLGFMCSELISLILKTNAFYVFLYRGKN